MPRAFLLPRAEHLSAEPQLAALAVLETAANVAILALGAENPEPGSSRWIHMIPSSFPPPPT
jgi:hypothetical protein